MRVRKSIPGGYKRGPKVEGQSDTLQPQKTLTGFSGLVRYCGILKVGGHSAQPVFNESDVPELHFDGEDADMAFFSSQESFASTEHLLDRTQPALASCLCADNDKKRRRGEEDDHHHEEDFDETQPETPRSRPISHTSMPNLDQLRAIAIPKSRRPPLHVHSRQSEMIDAGEFEEAEFLIPPEWNKDWAAT